MDPWYIVVIFLPNKAHPKNVHGLGIFVFRFGTGHLHPIYIRYVLRGTAPSGARTIIRLSLPTSIEGKQRCHRDPQEPTIYPQKQTDRQTNRQTNKKHNQLQPLCILIPCLWDFTDNIFIVHISTTITESVILKSKFFLVCIDGCILRIVDDIVWNLFCILHSEVTLPMLRNCLKLKRWINKIFLEILETDLKIIWIRF